MKLLHIKAIDGGSNSSIVFPSAELAETNPPPDNIVDIVPENKIDITPIANTAIQATVINLFSEFIVNWLIRFIFPFIFLLLLYIIR